jgi:hypothetical protein
MYEELRQKYLRNMERQKDTLPFSYAVSRSALAELDASVDKRLVEIRHRDALRYSHFMSQAELDIRYLLRLVDHD